MISITREPYLAPCKDCEERHPSCHSHCKKYQEWKSMMAAEKEKIAEQRIMMADLYKAKESALKKYRRIN